MRSFKDGEKKKMAATATKPEYKLGADARILIVDDEADILDVISDTVSQNGNCKLVEARTIAEAHKILHTQSIDLLVTDVHLPDGDGTQLLKVLREKHPNAKSIIISGSNNLDAAISAIRNGAVDFLKKPFTANELNDRVNKALAHQAIFERNEKRIEKLRSAVKRLNSARKIVSKKVDLLCNDLISAYGELSKQMDLVRIQEGYKSLTGDTKDLEQLLCHTMDFVMRQAGYCNIAIWLAGDNASHFQLGAYMKYTIAGEEDLTDAMRDGIVRIVDRENFVHYFGDELQEKLSPPELDYLADQDILAVNCTYLGETLGVIVAFRQASKGFTEVDAAMLKTMSAQFAVSLASVVREAQQSDESEGGVMDDDEEEDGKGRRGKSDRSDDWWKSGGPPPF